MHALKKNVITNRSGVFVTLERVLLGVEDRAVIASQTQETTSLLKQWKLLRG
jgi:hypothetical protein